MYGPGATSGSPGPPVHEGPRVIRCIRTSRVHVRGGGCGVVDVAPRLDGQTGGMQNSQPSGAKGFAVLVGIMVAIVLAIMMVAVLLSPR
jgi:hypothetical protein